jgi:hypothetical protein
MTPGKIQCETLDCDLATEVCCVTNPESKDRMAQCVPKPQMTENGQLPWVCGTDGLTVERSCDEQADCGSGKRCCTPLYDESELKREYCGAECGGERCLAGSTCTNGNPCATQEAERGGECPLALKPPTCGSAVCKLGERCCWNGEDQQGRCAKDCGEDARVWFECTHPDQCAPGYACNTWPGVMQYRCGGAGFQGGVMCRTLKDCPKHLSALGTNPGAPVARSCVHTALLPPGSKECLYE